MKAAWVLEPHRSLGVLCPFCELLFLNIPWAALPRAEQRRMHRNGAGRVSTSVSPGAGDFTSPGLRFLPPGL